MADLIRISYQSVQVIPQEHRRLLHSMYEDNDLDGAQLPEHLIEWLEQETPGMFVGVLANDSTMPGCDSWETNHYNCEYYNPWWYTVLISKKIWDEYEDRVKAKDQEWKDAHQCKLLEL